MLAAIVRGKYSKESTTTIHLVKKKGHKEGKVVKKDDKSNVFFAVSKKAFNHK